MQIQFVFEANQSLLTQIKGVQKRCGNNQPQLQLQKLKICTGLLTVLYFVQYRY